MRKLTTLFLLFIAASVCVEAQIPAAPKVLRYQDNKLAWDITAASIAEAQSQVYRLYANGQSTIISTSVTCNVTAVATEFHCSTVAPDFVVGDNLLSLTRSINAGAVESLKSETLALFYATSVSVKETIVNTEKQSILRCQPSSFEMLRITDATKMQAALNASNKHVAYMFATSNAVYAIFCTLLESGT